MNPVIRYFLTVIHRFKMTAVLNILGLSIAFATFIVIMFQLNYDFGFDKFHKDYNIIFRVEFIWNASAQANMCRPLSDRFIESSPHIAAGGIADIRLGSSCFYLEDDIPMHFGETYNEANAFKKYAEDAGCHFFELSKQAIV